MRTSRRSTAAVLFAIGTALVFAGRPAAAESPPAPPPDGAAPVRYLEVSRERPERRELAGPGLRAGIDINSEIVVDLDPDRMLRRIQGLAPATDDRGLSELMRRLQDLEEAASALSKLPEAYQKEAALVEQILARRSAGADIDENAMAEAKKARGRRAKIATQIILALNRSVRARLAPGLSSEAADAQVDRAMDRIYSDAPTIWPYDMEAFRDFVAEEIRGAEEAVERKLEELGEAGPAVELRGHLVRTNGTEEPVALEGHNLVEACVEREFEKLDFSLSPEEQELLDQYEELASQIRRAQQEGASVLQAVRQAFESQRIPIVEALEAAETAIREAGDRLQSLVEWADATRLRTWTEGPARQALAESDATRDAWKRLEEILKETKLDVETLESLGGLVGAIGGGTTSGDVARILGVLAGLHEEGSLLRALTPVTWADRVATVRSLISGSGSASLAALSGIDGPVKAWVEAEESIEAVRAALVPVQEGARQALVQLRGGAVAPAAANLPELQGQQRRRLDDKSLDTRFNLRSICGPRDEGDEIRVTYTLYRGDEEVDGAGWTDTMVIRIFGWRVRGLASVAMVRFSDADGDETWEPTAPISFLFSRRAWPSAGEPGLGSGVIPWSLGFSTMPLDFDEEESVELGLSVTLGLFDNFGLLGYGVNLQADEEDFFFLALRPFSLGGLFTPAQR